MQSGTHPDYGPVVFRDRGTGQTLLTRSPLVGRDDLDTIEIDGRTYPVLDVDVTSHSHPLWTGTKRTLDSEGRVEKFQRRYGRRA